MMDTYSKITFYCANKTQTDFIFFFSSSFLIFSKETIFF